MQKALGVLMVFVFALGLAMGPAGAEEPKGKVLLVSKGVMDPLAFKPLFDHFPETGYEFKYRRWHPSLVKQDAADFDVIIVETGSHPAPGPTRIYPEETALLKDFVNDGGTLVILATAGRRAQNEGEGSTSVYHINKMLHDLKTNIQFEGNRLMQPTGYKSTLIPSSYFLNMPMVHVSPETPMSEGISGPFPGGRIMSLLVGKDKGIEVAVVSDPLAMRMTGMDSSNERGLQAEYAGEPQRAFPVMAAAKAGEGHVIVTSQSILNMNGWTGRWSDKPILPPYELEDNRTFDRNFVHYIAEIDSGAYVLQDVIPMKRVESVGAPTKPEEVDDRDVGLRETAPEDTYAELIGFEDVEPCQPGYLDGKKVMSGFTGLPGNLDHIKQQVEGFKEMDLNLIFVMCGDTLYRRRGNPESYENFMEIIYDTLELYEEAGIKVMLGGFHPSRHAWQKKQYDTTLVDGNGKVYELPSPLDPESWEDTFASLAREFARIAKKYPDTVVGCFWDFELYAHRELIISESYPFDNYAFMKFVKRMHYFQDLRPGLYSEALGVDQARRFDWLEKNGLLADYYRCMEEEMFEMAKAVREQQEEIHPGLEWGFYVAGIPETWYYRGVFRGLSGDHNQVLCATYEARGRQQMNYWNAQGIKLMHLPGVLMAIPEDQEWVDFLHMSMEQESGYWLFPVAITTISDSAWRTQKNDSVMSQPPSEIRKWVRKANDTWKD